MKEETVLPTIFVIPGTKSGIDESLQVWNLKRDPPVKQKPSTLHRNYVAYYAEIDGNKTFRRAEVYWDMAMENPIEWKEGMFCKVKKEKDEDLGEDGYDFVPYPDLHIDYDESVDHEHTGVFWRNKCGYYEATIAHTQGVLGLGYYTDYRLAKSVVELALEDARKGKIVLKNHRQWWDRLKRQNMDEFDQNFMY